MSGSVNPVMEVDIQNDGDAEEQLDNLQGDLNDLINLLDAKDYGKALELCDDVQDVVGKIHSYLKVTVENG